MKDNKFLKFFSLIFSWLNIIIDFKIIRFVILFLMGGVGLWLSWISKEYTCCIKELFAWTEDGKVIDHLNAVLIGLPVFILLWFFRTRDTREQISQTRENIDQGNLFQALGDLTSKESLKIEIGVSRAIEISKRANKNVKKQIYFNFIKRLKEVPELKDDTVLTYAQHILVWLRDYIIENNMDKKVDLNRLKFDNQEFVIEEFEKKGKENLFNFFLNKKDRIKKYNIINCSFVRANLSSADLTGAKLDNVRSGNIIGFTENLPNNWKLINGYLIGPKANLRGADLTGANLMGVDLSGVDLTGANLNDADLTGANLDYVRSGNIKGNPKKLPDNWKLINGYLIGPKANLTGANLTGADLKDAKLNNVCSGNISGNPKKLPDNWKLINGYLIGPKANLRGADLFGANLIGADLFGADLFGADLNGAWYNKDTTKFPYGFNPKDYGMIEKPIKKNNF